MPLRAPALYLLTGMIMGLCAAKAWEAPTGLLLVSGLLIATLSLWLSLKPGCFWGLSFVTATTLSFWTYGNLRLPDSPNSAEMDLPTREAHLQFEVRRIFQAKNRFGATNGIAYVIEAGRTSRLKAGTPIYFRLTSAEGQPIHKGQRLSATGLLEPISANPNVDGFEAYLRNTHHVHHRFYRNGELKEIRAPSAFDRFCREMHTRFVNYLSLGGKEGELLKNIYIAMLLGQKAELNESQKNRFRMSGTMHLFAISGLHIGVIATVIAQFLLLLRVPGRLAPIIGLPLLYLYVEITGAPPSAVRAFLMAVFFWASSALARQTSPLAALSASAVFVLIFSPEQLWSIGFQLSYAVVLSILLFGLPAYKKLSERFAPFPYLPKNSWTLRQRLYAWIQDKCFLLFMISFSAWLAASTLGAAFFGYIPPGAILTNMLLVNLAALAISTGVVSLTCAFVGFEEMSAFLNHGAWLTIQGMDAIVIGSLKIPGMVFHCKGFPIGLSYWSLTIYFITLLSIHRMQTRISGLAWHLPPIIILSVLLFGWLTSQ